MINIFCVRGRTSIGLTTCQLIEKRLQVLKIMMKNVASWNNLALNPFWYFVIFKRKKKDCAKIQQEVGLPWSMYKVSLCYDWTRLEFYVYFRCFHLAALFCYQVEIVNFYLCKLVSTTYLLQLKVMFVYVGR